MQWAGHQLAALIHSQVGIPLHSSASVQVCGASSFGWVGVLHHLCREGKGSARQCMCMCMWGRARQARMLIMPCMHHQKGLTQQFGGGVRQMCVCVFVCLLLPWLLRMPSQGAALQLCTIMGSMRDVGAGCIGTVETLGFRRLRGTPTHDTETQRHTYVTGLHTATHCLPPYPPPVTDTALFTPDRYLL